METVLEVAGASERTEDEEYDVHVSRFDVMEKDMNECGAALTAVLSHQKSFLADAAELSRILNKLYVQNMNPEYWPNTNCAFTQGNAATAYQEAVTLIHEVIR